MARGKDARAGALLIALACVAAYVVTSLSGADTGAFGVCEGCALWRRIVWPFFHGNLLHLSTNLYVFLLAVFFYECRRGTVACAFAACWLLPPFVLSSLPAIGLSGVIYFLLGDITVRARKRLLFGLCVAGYIAFGFLLPHTAALLHLYMYCCGLVVSLSVTPLAWRKK